jgi:hypothetical protein
MRGCSLVKRTDVIVGMWMFFAMIAVIAIIYWWP